MIAGMITLAEEVVRLVQELVSMGTGERTEVGRSWGHLVVVLRENTAETVAETAVKSESVLALKAPITTAADNILIFFCFMRIISQADDSQEMSRPEK